MQNILTVIPIRSNSKGVENKNISLLNGRPLVEYVIESAIESKACSKIVISTDSEKYANICKGLGVDVPFLRPKTLGNSKVRLHHVMKHALEFFDKKKERFDAVLSLQATVPFIKPKTIRNVVRKFQRNNCESIGTISEIRHGHPYISKTLTGTQKIAKDFLPLNSKIQRYPRQLRPKLYYFNGSIFLRKRSLLINMNENLNCMGIEPHTYLMDEKESINIDTEFDFFFAETIIKANQR